MPNTEDKEFDFPLFFFVVCLLLTIVAFLALVGSIWCGGGALASHLAETAALVGVPAAAGTVCAWVIKWDQ